MRMHLLSSFLMIIVVGLACIPFIDDEKTPKAPTELEAVSITVDKVELQWKDNSDDEDGFRVFRDDQVLATTETERYTDNSVESESHYHYRVEAFNDIESAITREKQIKYWRREKKLWLINQENPDWRDLSDGL